MEKFKLQDRLFKAVQQDRETAELKSKIAKLEREVNELNAKVDKYRSRAHAAERSISTMRRNDAALLDRFQVRTQALRLFKVLSSTSSY